MDKEHLRWIILLMAIKSLKFLQDYSTLHTTAGVGMFMKLVSTLLLQFSLISRWDFVEEWEKSVDDLTTFSVIKAIHVHLKFNRTFVEVILKVTA